MLRPTSIAAALYNAAQQRAQQGVPKHDISRWVLARTERPGVGVVKETDTLDKVLDYLKRAERVQERRDAEAALANAKKVLA